MITLSDILVKYPPRETPKTPALVENMQRIIDNISQRVSLLAVNDAANYGWVLGSIDRLNEIITAAVYLYTLEQVPDVLMTMKPKDFGRSIRRYLMAARLHPDEVRPLAGVLDAGVFLIAAKPLIMKGNE